MAQEIVSLRNGQVAPGFLSAIICSLLKCMLTDFRHFDLESRKDHLLFHETLGDQSQCQMLILLKLPRHKAAKVLRIQVYWIVLYIAFW